MTASGILAALERKHSDAVFVAECKNGPTQTGSHRRFDAWVLLKTWSPVTTIGYEIKVDRADWRRDEKIADYMGLCHQLYLVAPKGVIPIEELPGGVGLMECVGDGCRLVTRRKAARREIEMPVSLMVYVLMCRAQIQRDRSEGVSRSWRLQCLKEWADGKDERRQLHYALGTKIRRVFEEQQQDIDQTKGRIKELEYIEARIIELGYDPKAPVQSWRVGKRLEEISGAIDPWTLKSMRQVEEQLSAVRQLLEKLKAGVTIDA